MHFDLVDLRLTVPAEANSLTRGAELVHMAVPTASTRVESIEGCIGTRCVAVQTVKRCGRHPPGTRRQ